MSGRVWSASVDHGPAHDRVRVWNRGGLAGELVVTKGDAVDLAERLNDGHMVQDRVLAIDTLRECATMLDSVGLSATATEARDAADTIEKSIPKPDGAS